MRPYRHRASALECSQEGALSRDAVVRLFVMQPLAEHRTDSLIPLPCNNAERCLTHGRYHDFLRHGLPDSVEQAEAVVVGRCTTHNVPVAFLEIMESGAVVYSVVNHIKH